MKRSMFTLAGGAAMAAALSMAATPAFANGGGWGHHRHDDGISAGDVLTGVLILGGIAAIASAVTSDNDRDDDRSYRESYPYPDERPEYRDSGGYGSDYGSRYGSSYGGGIDNAVEICTGEVERGSDRVASVDNAARTADGWRISGQLANGGNYDCAIDNNGRVRNVDLGANDYDDYDRGSWNGASGSGQWDDDAYAQARAQVGDPDPYGDSGY